MKTNSIHADRAVCARIITTTRHVLFRRACLWTGFLAFAMIAFGPQPAHAAVTETWVQRYSNVASSTTDEAVKVVRDAAGDIIVSGSTAGGIPVQDLLTIKYSGADGSVLWQQRYNGPANDYDFATAMAVDGGGNVVVTGVSNSRLTRPSRHRPLEHHQHTDRNCPRPLRVPRHTYAPRLRLLSHRPAVNRTGNPNQYENKHVSRFGRGLCRCDPFHQRPAHLQLKPSL